MFFDNTALSNQIPLRVFDVNEADAHEGFVFPRSVDLVLLQLNDGSGFGIARLGTEELRFMFTGQAGLSEAAKFTLAFGEPAQALGALKDLQRLEAMLSGRSGSSPHIPLTTRKRLRAALIGVDGLASELTYREIAIRIFGEELIERTWSDIDRVLKNRTIRAVQRGRRFVAGEYRKLLS